MTAGTFNWLVLQEVKRLLLARWVGPAIVLLCAFSAFSITLSNRDLQENLEAYKDLVARRVEAQLRAPGQPSGREAEPGLRVIRAPAAGSVLVAGSEPALPAAWEFTPAGTESLPPYRNEARGDGRRVGDIAEIITALGGLLALWLGVSTVLSDSAAGRLSALRTLPVAPETMAVVRLAGGTVSLIIIAMAWCATVILSVEVFVPADLQVPLSMPIRMAGPVACYLSLMFVIGTGAGAAAREGQSALVATFLIWIAIVFVVPQVNQLITRSVIDVVPRNRMEAERRDQFADATWMLEGQVGVAVAAKLPDVEIPTAEQQSGAFLAVGEPIWTAGLTGIREAAIREELRWLESRARADRIQNWLDGLNPSSWLYWSMAELAGTGRSTAAAWTQSVAKHEELLNRRLFSDRPRVNARVPWKDQTLKMAFDRHPAPRYSDLPLFAAPPVRAGAWTPEAGRSFAGLAAFTMIAMAAAYFRLWSRLR